jgi:hypothetical protein
MKSKTLIAVAVASACGWPAVAAATQDAQESGHWAVITPMSVSESGSWIEHGPAIATITPRRALIAAGAPAMDPAVPASVDESAPWMTAERAPRFVLATPAASLPNPQVPFGISEAGPIRYAEEVRAQAEHVAAVEHARIAAARVEPETVAIAPPAATEPATAPDGELAGLAAPVEAPDTGERAGMSAGLVESRQTVGAIGLVSDAPPASPAESERLLERPAGLVDTRQSSLGLTAQLDSEAGAGGPAPTEAEVTSPDVTLARAEAADAPATAQTTAEGMGYTSGTGITRSEGPSTEVPMAAPRADQPGPVDDTSVARRDPDAADFARERAAGDTPTPAEAPGIGQPGHIPGYADVTVHSGSAEASSR